ncbi:MAG: hypothetical protein J0L58_03645 [Burkholderiales bacterium]|nr:hypothetical protein [Burkholderiales bacterium]
MHRLAIRPLALACLAALAGAALTPPSQAAPTLVWSGRGTTNGVADRDPVTGLTNWGFDLPERNVPAHLVFDGFLRTRPVVDMVGFSAQSISFAAGAASFDISGGMVNSYGDIVNHSLRRQTISAQLKVHANQRWEGGPQGLHVTGEFLQAGGRLTVGKGAVLRPSSTQLTNGTLVLHAGGSLDLSEVDGFLTVLGTPSLGHAIEVSGVGAGAGFKASTNVNVQRGRFSVLDGAQVTTRHLRVSKGASNSVLGGELVVRGNGSELFVDGDLDFGGDSLALGRLSEGGRLRAGDLRMAGGVNNGNGSVLHIESGAQWIGSRLSLGWLSRRDEARLEVRQGGEMFPLENVVIGAKARSDDAAAVSGLVVIDTGGRWTGGQADVQLGVEGVGRLELLGGGQAAVRQLALGTGPLSSGRGELLVTGSGSLLTATGLELGRGQVEVLDGARLQAGLLTLRDAAQVRVDGRGVLQAEQLQSLGASSFLQLAGGTLTLTGTVRREGGLDWQAGQLLLSDGARFDTRTTPLERVGGAADTELLVAGGHWQARALDLGGSRETRLRIEANGRLEADRLTLGDGADRRARAEIASGSPAAAGLQARDLLIGGQNGLGEMVVQTGGVVQVEQGWLAQTGAVGRLQLDAGGRWSGERLAVGARGDLIVNGDLQLDELQLVGRASLRPQGQVQLDTLRLDGGRFAQYGGTLAVQQVTGSGEAEGLQAIPRITVVNGEDLALTAGQAAGPLQVERAEVWGGTLRLDYAPPVRLGLLDLSVANIVSASPLALGGLNVYNDATITGDLWLAGSASLARGAHLHLHGDLSGPGAFDNGNAAFSRLGGYLHLHGAFRPEQPQTHMALTELRFESGASLALDLADPARFERLAVQGQLVAGGTLALHFGGDASTWSQGGTFDLFDFGAWQGSFAQWQVTGLDAARVDFSRLGLDGTVRVSAVPEPAPALLLAMGLAALALRRCRARA